jgi:hypothetical protein
MADNFIYLQSMERVGGKHNDQSVQQPRCYNLVMKSRPVEVQPLDQISQIKHEILAVIQYSRIHAQRHRHAMVELVKEDG